MVFTGGLAREASKNRELLAQTIPGGIAMILSFFLNLAVAVILGSVIGFERQWRQRMAGLRTNALVSAGSALFALLSQDIVGVGDNQRIAAQVVSGVGFIGAGVIMRDGLSVRGLNTAATLWCSAAIGLLAGFGSPLKAAIGAFAVLGTNLLLRPVARRINAQPADAMTEQELHYQIRLVCREPDESHIRALILNAVTNSALTLRSIHSEELSGGEKVEVVARVQSSSYSHGLVEQILNRLSLEKGISAATWSLIKTDTAE